MPAAEAQARDHGLARREAGRPQAACSTGCTTGASRASATGARRSRSSTATTAAPVPVPEEDLPVVLPPHRGLPPRRHRRLAAGAARGVVPRAVPARAASARGARPTSPTPSSTRPGTSCATRAPSSTTGRSTRRARAKWLPVDDLHRRQRARGAAPAVLALPHDGAARPGPPRLRGAVPRVPRARPDREGRREDVEVPGQRRRSPTSTSTAGAPTRFRMYLMFLGPFEEGGDFRDAGISGVRRFLDKVWHAGGPEPARRRARRRDAARGARQVAPHQEEGAARTSSRCSYNTAIAAMMEMLNALRESNCCEPGWWRSSWCMLAPFAPHFAEECWERLGHDTSVFDARWPAYDPGAAGATTRSSCRCR